MTSNSGHVFSVRATCITKVRPMATFPKKPIPQRRAPTPISSANAIPVTADNSVRTGSDVDFHGVMAAPALASAFEVEVGSPHPLGATVRQNGVNFSLFSGYATGIELLLFDKHDSPQPLQTIPLIPSKNKTFHFWHILVKQLKAGAHYAFRVTGPSAPGAGHRYIEIRFLSTLMRVETPTRSGNVTMPATTRITLRLRCALSSLIPKITIGKATNL